MSEQFITTFITTYGPLGVLAISGWYAAMILHRRAEKREDQLLQTLINNTAALTLLTARIDSRQGES